MLIGLNTPISMPMLKFSPTQYIAQHEALGINPTTSAVIRQSLLLRSIDLGRIFILHIEIVNGRLFSVCYTPKKTPVSEFMPTQKLTSPIG